MEWNTVPGQAQRIVGSRSSAQIRGRWGSPSLGSFPGNKATQEQEHNSRRREEEEHMQRRQLRSFAFTACSFCI